MTTKEFRGTPPHIKSLVVLCSAVALVSLSACGEKNDGRTVGQKLDSAVTSTEQAAAQAKAKAETSMSKAGDAMKDATQKVESSGSQTAGSVVGAVDDVAITASIATGFAKDADLSAIKIDVDTKNGNVTLYGPAPTAAARDRATSIAKSVKGVNTVDNRLVVKAGTSG